MYRTPRVCYTSCHTYDVEWQLFWQNLKKKKTRLLATFARRLANFTRKSVATLLKGLQRRCKCIDTTCRIFFFMKSKKYVGGCSYYFLCTVGHTRRPCKTCPAYNEDSKTCIHVEKPTALFWVYFSVIVYACYYT